MGNQAGEETMVMERFDDEIEAQINQDLRLKHRRILLQVCKNKIFLLVKAIVELKTNPALKLTHRKILLPDSKSQIFLLVKHQNNNAPLQKPESTTNQVTTVLAAPTHDLLNLQVQPVN